MGIYIFMMLVVIAIVVICLRKVFKFIDEVFPIKKKNKFHQEKSI